MVAFYDKADQEFYRTSVAGRILSEMQKTSAPHGFVIRCPVHGRSPLSWSCQHVLEQALSDHPLGVVEVRIRAGEVSVKVFLCRRCFQLCESRRFRPEREVITACFDCLQDAIHSLVARGGDLFSVESR